MSRIHDRAPAFAVGQALDYIPDNILDLVRCEIMVGVDPVFAGMHEFVDVDDTLAYKDCAHVVYPDLQMHRPVAFRTVKMFLPSNPDYLWDDWNGVYTVVHELGHVLDHSLNFEHDLAAVTEYAETNREEAFAEAFASWIFGDVVLDSYTKATFNNL